MGNGISYYNMVCEVKEQILTGDNHIVMSVAGITAAIFACFAIIVVTKDMVTGDGISIWKVLKPFAILIILPMFGSVVLFVDNVMGGIASSVWAGVSADSDNYDAKYEALVARVESIAGSDDWLAQIQTSFGSVETIEGIGGEGNVAGEAAADHASNRGDDKPWYEKLWDRLKGWSSNLAQTAVSITGNVFSFIVSFLMNCVRYCLIGAAGVYLTILGIIGPIVLSLSLIPTFENTITQWLARYIQVSMWVPLTSLVDFVNCKMRVALINVFSSCNIETMATFPVHQLLMNIIMLGMLFAVPSMANWIIQSTGASNVYRGLTQKAGMVATRFITKK